VLVGIANHDGDGGAWPAVATLARYACISERQVQYIIRELTDRGLLEVHANDGGDRRTRNDRRPNRYTLHVDNPPDGVNSTAPRDDDGVKSSAQRGEAHFTRTVLEPSICKPPTDTHARGDEPAAEDRDIAAPIVAEAARMWVQAKLVAGVRVADPAALRSWKATDLRARERERIDRVREYATTIDAASRSDVPIGVLAAYLLGEAHNLRPYLEPPPEPVDVPALSREQRAQIIATNRQSALDESADVK
jgi:hypothetical protein